MATTNLTGNMNLISPEGAVARFSVDDVPLGGTVTPFNVVVINSADDFPDPIGGVIELVPTPGDNIVYEVGALTVDLSSYVFTATGGAVVIRGVHRTASQLSTTGSGTMFTVVDGNFFLEFIGLSCPNADVIDFSTTSGTKSFATQNAIIYLSLKLGTIANAFTSSFRVMTTISITDGFTWVGTENAQINISNFLAFSWTNTLFNLGAATFGLINITGNNRFISVAGNTTISGLAANGNFNDGDGRAAVEGNIFDGDGAAVSGINVNDNQWNFAANAGVADSRVDADIYLSAPRTVPVAAINTFYPVNGPSWVSDIANRMTVDASGMITYTGLADIDVHITATSTVEKVGGGSDQICTVLTVAGVDSIKSKGCTQNSLPTQVVSQGIYTLSEGDEVLTSVQNVGSTADVIVSVSSINITSTT